jgi:hypothetical protein
MPVFHDFEKSQFQRPKSESIASIFRGLSGPDAGCDHRIPLGRLARSSFAVEFSPLGRLTGRADRPPLDFPFVLRAAS